MHSDSYQFCILSRTSKNKGKASTNTVTRANGKIKRKQGT